MIRYEKEMFDKVIIEPTLEQIQVYGLCPPYLISAPYPKPVLGLGDQAEINEICIKKISIPHEIFPFLSDVLKIVCYEINTGIYSTLLERRWPFHTMNSDFLKREIMLRLCCSMVFILAYPLKSIENKDQDQVSSCRPKGLLTKTKLKHGLQGEYRQIMEIRTSSYFTPEVDIHTVLVPEPFIKMANHFFKTNNISIIPVPIGKITLNKLPEILEKLHKQTLPQPMEIFAPQYEESLKKLIVEDGLKDFTLHTLPLNSHFDFSYRFIKEEKAITELHANIHASLVPDYPTSNWLRIHKMYTTPAIEESCLQGLEKAKSEEIKQANNFFASYREKIGQAKGENKIMHVHFEPTTEQVKLLKEAGINVVISVWGNYAALAFPAKLKEKVTNILGLKTNVKGRKGFAQSTAQPSIFAPIPAPEYKEKNSSEEKEWEQLKREATKELRSEVTAMWQMKAQELRRLRIEWDKELAETKKMKSEYESRFPFLLNR